jgi:glycosyltransferase involved in cell wall biosynthesis
MPDKLQLAFAAWGDPFAPSTWSGTSANLAQAMQALDIDIIGLNCRPPQLPLMIEHGMHRLVGQDIRYTRQRAGRRLCTRLAASLPPGCAGILHMSSVTIPPRGSTPGVRHFLLCDSMNDYWQRFSEDEQALSPRQKARREVDENEAVAGTDLFFPTAHHVADSLQHHYRVAPDKIRVVGTGRGKIKALSGTKDYSTKHVLMVAKLRFKDKGGPLLLRAIQIARKTDPEIRLTLVSPDEFRQYVTKDVSDGVTITGTVPWDELQNIFDTATLYAMPAPGEPWGLVYVEALATKTPILGLNRAALPELTNGGKSGFLVDDATPEAIAAALVDAVSDPARLQRMGEIGQQYALANFSWERTASFIKDKIFG